MTIQQGAFDANQGQPNLGALQYLQDKLTPSSISQILGVAKVQVITGGDAGVAADIPVGAEIITAVSVCTRSNGSGSMTLKTGAGTPVAISNAMQCATDKEVAYAATIDDATNVVGANGVKVFANGASDGANVFILYKK